MRSFRNHVQTRDLGWTSATLLLPAALAACTGTIHGGTAQPEAGAPGSGGENTSPPSQGGEDQPPGGGTGGSHDEPSCSPGGLPVAAVSPRLLQRQFNNTLASLFPFAITPGQPFPGARGVGFTTSLQGNAVLSADAEAFAELGDTVGLQAIEGARLRQILPCSAQPNRDCALRFIDDFVPRAFRRPIEQDERAGFATLYDSVTGTDALTFPLAAAAIISATLQSPQFMYLLEIGEVTDDPAVRRLSPYEIASRLSYLYWDAPPDAALLDKARAGTLSDPAVVAGEVERLLADGRGHQAATRFLTEWLGAADRTFDQHASGPLAADFKEEITRFLDDAVFGDSAGRLPDLLSSGKTFVNRRLAQHYGLPLDGLSDATWTEVTLPAGQAAGVLSKAQVTAAHAGTSSTSIVRRGHFILEGFTCHDTGSPPAGAQDKEPVLPATATVRERSDARIGVSPCGSCHRIIDPIGIGMEDLDQVGRLRTQYSSGAPLDLEGDLAVLDEGDFRGTAALAGRLASDDVFATCMTRQWFRYATGLREEGANGECAIDRMKQQFTQSGLNVRALLGGFASSDAFRFRATATP